MVWVDNPRDMSGIKVDIVPAHFDARGFCIRCSGSIQFDFKCSRCNIDYFPAVQRRNRQREKERKANAGKTD